MKQHLVIGVVDAITAHEYSNNPAVSYTWASSFVMSAMLGMKDDGIVNIKVYILLIKAIVKASKCPVIIDLDVGGKNNIQYHNNLHLLKKLRVGGVCIEDEMWPKMNAMLKHSARKLISPISMAKNIRAAKKILDSRTLVIARTHSLLIDEPLSLLQERINNYQAAGADVLCLHYTGNAWKRYQKTLDKLRIIKPLFLILSKRNSVPKELLSKPRFQFILYPNQLYRTMLYSVIPLSRRNGKIKRRYSFSNNRMFQVNELFSIIEKINAKN